MRGEPGWNASWHDNLQEPVGEALARRRRQLVQMARYARSARPDELLGWGDVGLREFQALFDALVEVVKAENSPGEDS